MPSPSSDTSLRRELGSLYAAAPTAIRWRAMARPLICPFDLILDRVPAGSGSVLDFGCGAGILLNLLAARGRIARGDGYDVDSRALAAAGDAAGRAHSGVNHFHLMRTVADVPAEL
jgi:methylase of polypeptide subunit release factors